MFIVAVLFCSLLTVFVKNYAIRNHVFDNPKRARKVHNRDIPRLGGVAIITSFTITLTIGSLFCDPLAELIWGESIALIVIFFGGLIIFFLGIFDDFFGLSHKTKLLVQFVVIALVVCLAEIAPFFLQFPILGKIFLPSGFSFLLAFLWITGMTNSINLVDGLDGLATGISLIGLLAIIIVTYTLEINQVLFPAFLFSGCLLGFLIFNSRPACIFLGDCGSLTTGYFVGCFSLLASFREKGAIEALFPVILFAVPIADCFLAIFRRLFSGRSPFYPDVEHIHHRLMKKGLSHGKTVVVIWLIALICAYVSVALEWFNRDFLLAILVSFVFGCLVLLRYLGFFRIDFLTKDFVSFIEKRNSVVYSERIIKKAETLLKKSTNYENLNKVLESIALVLDCDEIKLCFFKQLKVKTDEKNFNTRDSIKNFYWKSHKSPTHFNSDEEFVLKYPLAGRNTIYGDISYRFISKRFKIQIEEEIQLERIHDALVVLATKIKM